MQVTMTAEQFTKLTGHAPENDDLERVNCEEVGLYGHSQCGLCGFCGWPRFIVNVNCDHRNGLIDAEMTQIESETSK
jgi:hypothetical protein